MTKTIKVTNSLGEWELVKPKAKVRNAAMEEAEISEGRLKMSVLLNRLLPKCINKRPEGVDDTVPIQQVLDGLEIEDYDLLGAGLGALIQDSEEIKNIRKNAPGNLSTPVDSLEKNPINPGQ